MNHEGFREKMSTRARRNEGQQSGLERTQGALRKMITWAFNEAPEEQEQPSTRICGHSPNLRDPACRVCSFTRRYGLPSETGDCS